MIYRLDDKNIYVGNQGIDRVYLGDKVLKSNEPPVYIATDDDFVVGNFDVYIYRGKPLEVDISDFVNRKGLTETMGMFSGASSYRATPVTRVVLGPNNVTNMANMFSSAKATSLDLSSFDASSVTNTVFMFNTASATTGYARTQEDADKFNASVGIPSRLRFVVHPDLV